MTNPFIAALLAQAAGEDEEQEQESPFQDITPQKGPQEPKEQVSPFGDISAKEPVAGEKELETRFPRRVGKAEAVIESAFDRPFTRPERALVQEGGLDPVNERLLQQVDDREELERREQREDLIRSFGQAQLAFAPDITGDAISNSNRSLIEVIGDNTPGALPLLLGGPAVLSGIISGDEEARRLLDPDTPLPPPQNLEEVIDNNIVDIPPGLPFGVPIAPRDLLPQPRPFEEAPILSTGLGPAGDVFRAVRDMTARLRYDLFGTTLQFASAPFVLSYLGFKEAIQNTTITGPDGSPQRMRIDQLRDRFVDDVGRLTPFESAEARRGFQAILATAAYAGAVRAGLGPGNVSRRIVARQELRKVGGNVVEALEAGLADDLAGTLRGIEGLAFAESPNIVVGLQQLEKFVNFAGGLATFGVFVAEPGEKAARAISFTLGAIPLYAVHTFLSWIGSLSAIPPTTVRSPGRASQINNMRSARPFDKETGPIPDVATNRGNVRTGVEGVDFEVVPTMDRPTHPDFAPRSTVVQTARRQQQRIEREGIPDPAPVPSSITERRAASDAARRRLFEVEERRKPVGEQDVGSGRRLGERRDIIRNAEKREISKVKNELIEALGAVGIPVRGDLFQEIASENFIMGLMAQRGAINKQFQLLVEVLRRHFPEAQITNAELSQLATDALRELNETIKNRNIAELTDIIGEVTRGKLQAVPPDPTGLGVRAGERREAAGRRGMERVERRARLGNVDFKQRPEGIGLINDMVLLALRQSRGNVEIARRNLQVLMRTAATLTEPGTSKLIEEAVRTLEEAAAGLDQLNTFKGFPTITRRVSRPGGVTGLDVASFEAFNLDPATLEALAAGKEIAQVQSGAEILGDVELAAELVTLIEISNTAEHIEGIGADRRIAEIESQLTQEQRDAFDRFIVDEFGVELLTPNELRDIAALKRRWDPDRLENEPTDQLVNDIIADVDAPPPGGLELISSLIKQVGVYQTLLNRGLSAEQIGTNIATALVSERGVQPEDANAIFDDWIVRVESANRRLGNVPRQVEFPAEPLNPSEIAENAANWIRNDGEPVATLLDQVRNKPNQTVIVRGEETPGNVLAQAVDKLDSDYDVITHERPDGLFDIAIAGPGSPLQLELPVRGELRKVLREQFVEQGRFNGQKVYINGVRRQFVRIPDKDPANVIIRDRAWITEKNPKGERKVARSLLTDARDVESINEFDRVANTQRGLPERAMLRIKDAQISQMYDWLAEYVGDLTRIMSEGIAFSKGNFSDMLLSVDKLIREMEPIGELEVRIMREIAENSLVKTNPIIPENILQEVRAGITADPGTLTAAERRDLDRLKVLGRDYAGFHAEIPTINRVQGLAQNAAIAIGEFKFEEALSFLKALQGELGKGRENWEIVTANSTTPSIREIVEKHLDPEELETWDRLVEALAPPDARKLLESGEEFSFDQLRAVANSNGLRLEINTSGTYVLKGQDRGLEIFASPNIKDIAKFMRDSGQAEGLDMDAAHDVDPDIPGATTPPPTSPPRVNEPMPFPPGRLIEMLLEGATVAFPFAAPFKDFAASHDALNKTDIHNQVWVKTNVPAFEAAALGARWMNFQKKTPETTPGLKDIEALLEEAGFKNAQQRELANRYLNTMSKEEVMDLLNTSEKATVEVLDIALKALIEGGETGVSAERSLNYLDDLRTELRNAAKRMGFGENIERLDEFQQRQAAERVRREKNYTEPDVIIAKLFSDVAKRPASRMDLPLIIRAFEAGRTGSKSRADFAAENNFTAEQIAALNEYDALLERITQKPGVKIKDVTRLRAYLGNYAWRQSPAPEDAYLNQKDISPELEFVNSMVRMGETNAYSQDPIEVAARFIRGAANQSTGFDKAWNEAQQYVNTLPKNSVGRMVAESYLGAVRGNLPAISREVENVMASIFKTMGWKVPPITVRNMVNSVLALMSTSAISFRFGLTVRDLTSGISLHYSRFGGSPIKGQGFLRKGLETIGIGPSRTIRMLELAFSNIWETRRDLVTQGVIPSVGPIRFQTPSELLSSNLGKGIGALPKFMQDVANFGFVVGGQKTLYEMLFTGTLLESREFVGNASKMFQNGEITKAEFYNIIKLDSFQRAVQKEFDDLIVQENWEQAVELLSRQSGVDFLGLYGMGQHPWGWGTNTGKLFGQFGIWPVNAAQYVLGGLTRGKKNSIPVLNHFVSGRQIGFATRLAMTQAGFLIGGRALGMDLYRWLLFPGIFFTGGPTVQMALDVADIVNGSDDDRRRAVSSLKRNIPVIDTDDMRNTDIRSMFFPFSYFIMDMVLAKRAWENGEPFPGILGRFFSVPLSDKPSWIETGSPFFFQEE